MDGGNLRYKFARLTIAEKLIVINVVIFIISGLIPFLLGLSPDAIVRFFELPKDFTLFIILPWSLVTYSFFHGSFWHLFWNMIILYFSSRIFLNLFGPKRFIAVYFLGVMLGGLVFMLSYNLFPVFSGTRTALIGASAGVTAVLIFVCTYIPNQQVRLFFFNVKLWYIGVFLVVMDLVQIPTGNNAGGNLAHLGGAFLGYLYARQLMQGTDIGAGFIKFLDTMGSMFGGRKKPRMKTVYKKKTSPPASKVNYEKENKQRKIDAILDKISKSGYESLSKEEKDFLFKAGKEDK